MDVELTSTRDDDTFTWRAAGARQPRGSVAASMLPKGSKVGDVLRIEAEVELDGITIVAVLPPKGKDTPADRIEVVGTQRPVAGVTTVLAGPSDRRRESPFFRDGNERRPPRPAGDRSRRREGTPPTEGAEKTEGGESTEGPRAERHGAPPRREGEGGARGRSRFRTEVASARRDLNAPAAGTGGSGGPTGGRRSDGRPPARPGAGPRTGPARGRDAEGGRDRPQRTADRPADRPGPADRTGDRMARPRRGPVRLEPGTKHRDELMATLPGEQQIIADRLATGGMPAVRKAIAEEQGRAQAEGRPPVAADSILELAEQLQPDVKAALWLDRAESVLSQIDEIGLRDLRTTVVAATPRDDAGRELERQLREGLERRVAKLRTDWEQHLTQALEEGRVLQALRLSARPPEPTARFPAGLIERLTSQVGAAMTVETPPERWLALLEAATLSPLRRQIHPAGIPQDPSGEVGRKAREAAGRLPALAPMLGMSMPPPPKPIPGERIVRTHPMRPAPRPRPPRGPAGAPAAAPAAPVESATPETPAPEVPAREASEVQIESVAPAESPVPESTSPEAPAPAPEASEAQIESATPETPAPEGAALEVSDAPESQAEEPKAKAPETAAPEEAASEAPAETPETEPPIPSAE